MHGALLTVDLLRDIFKWLDDQRQKEGGKGARLVHEGVQIQVYPDDLKNAGKPHPAADRGLFLSFMANTGFGRVRLRLGTKFDWIPAQVDSNNVVYYGVSTEGGAKWLAFNVSAKKYQGVELRERLDGPECLLLKLIPDDTCPWMRLGVETGKIDPKTNSLEKIQLRMQATNIKLYDEKRETSELSFVFNGGRDSKDPVSENCIVSFRT